MPNLSSASLRASFQGAGLRGRLVGGLCLFFLLAGGAWLFYWIFFLAARESTDDAYVSGNQARISAQVTGTVKEIFADNTQAVRSGQILVRLDDTDARLALSRARASLADTVRRTRGLMLESERLSAIADQRLREYDKAWSDYARRREHRTAMSVSEEELSHARDNAAIAQSALRAARLALEANHALLGEGPLREQPQVLLAADRVREAWLALKRCEIASPVDGFVARRSAQVGLRVTPGQPLMAVIPLAGIWVDANFKEVQLSRMRIGQPAVIRTDFYGGSVLYQGTVAGFTAGTGSSFSLLPPENATGNWIKVIQRVPVKIALNPDEVAQNPLLLGLSCLVSVDVSDARGRMLAPATETPALYATDVLTLDPASVNAEIEEIIRANSAW
ncbi:MAG: efflux RND transporter periplasmic adaptor subunit [Desulfovibrio sp.]|jgi:membrane fusion protein (multidrug efflux system)|nr:efflux RND transporter periplasmic adaptor subunit [Desulfovibrio sp.]